MKSPACSRSSSARRSSSRVTCFFTVGSLMPSALAISLFEQPSASSCATSMSRGESGESPAASADAVQRQPACPARTPSVPRRPRGSWRTAPWDRRCGAPCPRAPWAAATCRQSCPPPQSPARAGSLRLCALEGGLRIRQSLQPRSDIATIGQVGKRRAHFGQRRLADRARQREREHEHVGLAGGGSARSPPACCRLRRPRGSPARSGSARRWRRGRWPRRRRRRCRPRSEPPADVVLQEAPATWRAGRPNVCVT